jgi:hypothetical protein
MADAAQWITVGELAQALTLHLENGQIVAHHFDTEGKHTWTIADRARKEQKSEKAYVATKVRDGIYSSTCSGGS